MSIIRKSYMIRLVMRSVVFVLCLLLFWLRPSAFAVLQKGNFFRTFSVFHLLWLVWVMDMFLQLVPVKAKISLGSRKNFRHRFRPIQGINYQALRQYIVSTTKAAYQVMLLWIALLAVIGYLYYTGVIGAPILFLISVCFYVCDLICVLIWCPFRLILKTRCCTTCRIFNWDHLMMFTPMMFLPGFYARSLLLMAFAVWLIWELCVLLYPERFWEYSNEALRCSACTDKLCTQYCQKIRQEEKLVHHG